LIDQYGKNPSKLDINCVDPLGRSALVLAIENENMELIEILLQQPAIKPGDALLHAINEEYVEAVEMLLEHEERVHKPGMPYSWEKIDHDVSTYTKDITPLILAAHRDNYEILKLLLDRGATLPLPHDVKCGCEECITATNEDCLKYSRSRIHAYRALCSPSLIALSSRDPILTAFQLSWELRRLHKVEMEFAVEYGELRLKVQNFAVALLDHIRSTYELQVCLNYNPSKQIEPIEEEDEEEGWKLARLKLAIDYKQKQFVAHPNVQQMLGSVWFHGMPGFRRKGHLGQLRKVIAIAFKFPIYCLSAIFMPTTKLGRKIKLPFIKFITASASYAFFLLMLVLASQRVESLIVHYIGVDKVWKWLYYAHSRERGKWPTLVEWVIIVYIFGFIWQETCQLFDAGLIQYVSDMWNIVDFMTNIVYVNWLGLRLFSFVQVYLEELRGEYTAKPREEWDPYDPMLLSEGMFGAANILSFLKLVHIFSVHPHLGPLQISLGRMVFDILKFFFLFILVLFAFGCGINQLLWYYADKDYQKCFQQGYLDVEAAMDKGHSCEIWRRFSNLFETSQTLFWASFGLIELHNFDMSGIKEFTRFWGMLMFGSYSVINVVVLLNLLIAMMSNSFQLISGRSDVEWKFARSKLWISYFDDKFSIPPPFNLIPPVGKCCASVKKKIKPAFSGAFRGTINKKTYEAVMCCLVRRYVTREQRKAEETGVVTEDDVNEIKQDIASFRYELLDILKNNGMQCNRNHIDRDVAGKKERIRERRLLKGFNIGFIDKGRDSNFSDLSIEREEDKIKKIMKIIPSSGSLKKHQLARKRWTTAVTAVVKQNGSQIGRTTERHSLKDLRRRVLSEVVDLSEESSDEQSKEAENIEAERVKMKKNKMKKLDEDRVESKAVEDKKEEAREEEETEEEKNNKDGQKEISTIASAIAATSV
ncbi:transient receptor potential ion channel subfamily C trp-like protein, partial [Dinothrombium tinctorium]